MELRLPIRVALVLILNLMILIIVSGCTTTAAPKKQISCDFIYDKKDFSECLACAMAGDPNAAFNVAKIYDEVTFDYSANVSAIRLNIKKDRTTAFYWYKVAADLGHEKSLRIVFDGYYYGRLIPENKKEAEHYLKKSADRGHQWAMLVLAHRYEEEDPEKAMDLYLELAAMDNCHAQANLAKIYFHGKLVPQNLCKSYFWALLASVGGFNRRSDNHTLASGSGEECFRVSVFREKYNAEKELGPKYVQIVQDATSRWSKGQKEPDFPLVQSVIREKPEISKIKPPDALDFSRLTNKEKILKWNPAQIDLNKQLTSNLTPSGVFNLVNPSVWTVISTFSAANLKAMNNITLASAVAISENTLLTNYHVIDRKPYILIKQGERYEKAIIVSGDKLTDRCILHVENIKLKPIKGFRKYNSLAIGETVYSVGSPKGLENTLGQGIISGKRKLLDLKLIQTTAQISKGSSGGGLFDGFGNLIGITTFKMVESDGLNFAIAIDDFSH